MGIWKFRPSPGGDSFSPFPSTLPVVYNPRYITPIVNGAGEVFPNRIASVDKQFERYIKTLLPVGVDRNGKPMYDYDPQEKRSLRAYRDVLDVLQRAPGIEDSARGSLDGSPVQGGAHVIVKKNVDRPYLPPTTYISTRGARPNSTYYSLDERDREPFKAILGPNNNPAEVKATRDVLSEFKDINPDEDQLLSLIFNGETFDLTKVTHKNEERLKLLDLLWARGINVWFTDDEENPRIKRLEFRDPGKGKITLINKDKDEVAVDFAVKAKPPKYIARR